MTRHRRAAEKIVLISMFALTRFINERLLIKVDEQGMMVVCMTAPSFQIKTRLFTNSINVQTGIRIDGV